MLEVEDFRYKALIDQFKRIVPIGKRRKIWDRMIRAAVKMNKQRIKEQKNIDGSKFAPRKRGTKKMLTKLLSKKQLRTRITDHGAMVQAFNPVAEKHHHGLSVSVKAWTREDFEEMRKNRKEVVEDLQARNRGAGHSDSSECTIDQAKALRREVGFTHITLDGKRKRATIKNLQRAFTVAVAGWILKKERAVEGAPKRTHWKSATPPRDVMGLSPDQKRALTRFFAEMVADYSTIGKRFLNSIGGQASFDKWKQAFVESYA